MELTKRVLALLLSAVMVVGLCPIPAYAVSPEAPEQTEEAVIRENPDLPEPEETQSTPAEPLPEPSKEPEAAEEPKPSDDIQPSEEIPEEPTEAVRQSTREEAALTDAPDEDTPEEAPPQILVPDAPVVKASNDPATGKPRLTWEAVEGAVEYKVYRATSKSGSYSLKKTTSGTSYTNTGATAGKTYYYYVVAIGADGSKSPKSAKVSRTCDLKQPEITVNTVTSSGKIRVSWKAVADAVKYEVYRATSEDGSFTLMKTTTSLSYTNTSAKPGSVYYYKVRAIAKKSAANSAYSPVLSAACILAQPEISMSNDASSGKVKISWKAVSGAAGYEVYRCGSKDGEYALLGATEKLSLTDDLAQPGESHYYKVIAVAEDPCANSTASNAKLRTCDLPRPVVKLSNVAASGKIRITWDAIAGATGYEVYRATSKTGSYSLLKTVTGTSLTNTSTTAGKTYYYKVRALAESSAANSAYSEVKSRTCDLKQPVITVKNVADSGKIKVSWEKISGAVKYEVYRATSEDGSFTLMKSTTSTSYTNTSAKVGSTYYYKVKAIGEKSSADSAESAVSSGLCKLPRPVVTGSNVSSTGKVKLTWEAVDGAVGYEVYRSTNKSSGYTLLKSLTGTSLTNTSAEAGTTYYYKVKAIAEEAAVSSAFSSVVTRTCDLPRTTVTVTTNNMGRPKLSWDKVSGAVEYQVYRATSKSGSYSLIKTTKSSSMTDSDVQSNTTYYYKVKAIASKSAANSAYSSVKSIKLTYVVSAYEEEVIRLVNVERKNNGLDPLECDYELSKLAWMKSQDMQTNHYFSHTSPTYGSPFEMMHNYGITYYAAGENIAWGYTSPASVVNGWMNSEGHRANILYPGFTHIGVGHAAPGNYWTQMFIGK